MPLDCTYGTCYTYYTWKMESRMSPDPHKQNVTISLSKPTLRKAKVLAARRDTSISGLLAQQVEILVGEEEAYERAERQAITASIWED